ncbi:hypothetical protein V6N13_095527 [Hibiscus sabdariffa]
MFTLHMGYRNRIAGGDLSSVGYRNVQSGCSNPMKVLTNSLKWGAGVINIHAKNQALFAKWFWRFTTVSQALWRKIGYNKSAIVCEFSVYKFLETSEKMYFPELSLGENVRNILVELLQVLKDMKINMNEADKLCSRDFSEKKLSSLLITSKVAGVDFKFDLERCGHSSRVKGLSLVWSRYIKMSLADKHFGSFVEFVESSE